MGIIHSVIRTDFSAWVNVKGACQQCTSSVISTTPTIQVKCGSRTIHSSCVSTGSGTQSGMHKRLLHCTSTCIYLLSKKGPLPRNGHSGQAQDQGHRSLRMAVKLTKDFDELIETYEDDLNDQILLKGPLRRGLVMQLHSKLQRTEYLKTDHK
ncbi:hypothetical protein EMCRGX_G008066 [Ephydatia muelleri]